MKIHQCSRATMVKGLAVYAVPFLVLDLMVWLSGDDAQAAVGYSVFIAVVFVVVAVRSLSVPNKCWVEVTPEGIGWRTPPKPRRLVTPSGSVPLRAISSFEVFPQQLERRHGRPLNGEAVRLILADGNTITLPLWCPAKRRTKPFERLLAELRSVKTDRTNGVDVTS